MTVSYGKSTLGFYVDTNIFGRQVGEKSLEKLKDLIAMGGEVYVPDVVCLELASHDFEDLNVAINRLNNLGVYSRKNTFTRKKLETAITKLITNTGAKVLATSPEYYKEGVCAQIYSIPPAEAKPGPQGNSFRVTTGAVDYIVYLHAKNHAISGGSPCVITKDKILGNAIREIEGATVVTSFDEAIHVIGTQAVGESDLRSLIGFVLSDGFISKLRDHENNSGRQIVQISGLPQAVLRDDGKVTATVAVSCIARPENDNEYFANISYPEAIIYYSIEFNLNTFEFEVLGQTDSVPFIRWSTEATREIDEFMNFELSMFPFLFKPKKLTFGEEEVEPEWNYFAGHKEITFNHYFDPIATVTWKDEAVITQGTTDDNEMFTFEIEHIRISVSSKRGLESAPAKGVLFKVLGKYWSDIEEPR